MNTSLSSLSLMFFAIQTLSKQSYRNSSTFYVTLDQYLDGSHFETLLLKMSVVEVVSKKNK